MRRFELILAFATVFAVAWPVVFGVRPRRGLVALALTAAFVAQLQVEGYRWQLLPLYVVAIAMTVGDLIFIDRSLAWSNRVARGVFGLAGIGIASALPVLLPVPLLPNPSGSLAIGTITVELSDPERVEAYGAQPGDPRRLVAQVWYPAERQDDVQPIPWSADWDIVAPAMARRLGLPSWFLDHSRYTMSHSVPALPVAAGSYPVVIYSHGWTGFRTIAVNQVEALVSNGYIVIAPDHTYGAVSTRFPSGDVVEYDPAALPSIESVGEDQHLSAADTLIETFAGDIGLVLDALERGVQGQFAAVANSADLGRVGVYGHSTGGGAAVRFCLVDERCDAVLGLDPWVEPLSSRVLRETPVRPALFMRSEDWIGTANDAVLRGLAARSESTTYLVGVSGSNHNDFVITPLLSPVAGRLGLKGPIAAGRMLPIVENYLIGFFDVFLLGTGPASLENVSFTEVSVEVITPS